MQTITRQDLTANEGPRMAGGADALDIQSLRDELLAARRTLGLLHLHNGIDLLSGEDGEFEQGIRHSATFVQEILDGEMTSAEGEHLIATAAALGTTLPDDQA